MDADARRAIVAASDPLVGAMLVVAGTAPCVARVASADPRGIGGFGYQSVLDFGGEHFTSGQLWPDYIPSPLRQYRTALVVPATALRDVDLLWVVSGSTYIGTYEDAYYLWQPANRREALARLASTRHVRAALASPWLASFRPDDGAQRGIRLRQ